MPYVKPLTREFIEDRVEINEHGCWMWQLSLDPQGYALIGPGAQERFAHRLSYVLYKDKGEIPPGLTVDHICFISDCVNPDHLQLLTSSENSRRHSGVHRDIPVRGRVEKTHCKRGHEYNAENLRVYNGKKDCMACQRARREAKRAA